MKNLLAVLLAIMVGSSAWAAQIGDEVSSFVSLQDRVTFPNNQATELTHIDLDDGVWDISGSIQYFLAFMRSACVIGGSIAPSVALTTDGSEVFQSASAPNWFQGIALSSRTIDINGNGVRVFLVGYSIIAPQPPPQPVAQAWGFLSARKIRNNH